MTLEHTLEIVKILLRHYGEHPSQNDALIAGALVILEGAPTKQTEHGTKKDKPKTGAPRRGGRPPFDTGKMKACLKAGRSIGLLKDEQQADSV